MKIVILSAALLLALPAVAAAQSATSTPLIVPPSVRPVAVPGLNLNLPGVAGFDQSGVEMERLRRDGGGSRAERRERAERLVVLVNSGQCQAAHDAAVQERDRVMAERIGNVCRSAATAANPAS